MTMVRKKWLGLYYSTYWCYIHQTCTNCSSYDLLMPHVVLCPWPIFHRHCGVVSVQLKIGQPCDLPVNSSYSLYRKVQSSFIKCCEGIIEIHVHVLKTSNLIDWLAFGVTIAKFRVTCPYLSWPSVRDIIDDSFVSFNEWVDLNE